MNYNDELKRMLKIMNEEEKKKTGDGSMSYACLAPCLVTCAFVYPTEIQQICKQRVLLQKQFRIFSGKDKSMQNCRE